MVESLQSAERVPGEGGWSLQRSGRAYASLLPRKPGCFFWHHRHIGPAALGFTLAAQHLRTIAPFDSETLINSVMKTRRLIVVDEDYEKFGVSVNWQQSSWKPESHPDMREFAHAQRSLIHEKMNF